MTVERLLPFNNRRNCPKCGSFMQTLVWIPGERPHEGMGSLDNAERLQVTCSTCGYYWYEVTRDVHGDGTLGLVSDG